MALVLEKKKCSAWPAGMGITKIQLAASLGSVDTTDVHT